MATIHRADGSRLVLDVGAAGLTLKQMQEAVGGFIEVVYLGGSKLRREVLIVNEDGLRLGLAVNEYATRRYRGEPPRHNGIVVGDVIEALMIFRGPEEGEVLI